MFALVQYSWQAGHCLDILSMPAQSKKNCQESKRGNIFSIAMLTTQSPNGLYYLSFLVKLFDSIEVYLPGKLKAYLV